MPEGLRLRHPGSRQFDDPGVLRLRQSAWATWELFSAQYHQGNLSKRERTEGTKRPRVEANEAELSALMEELGL